MMNHTALAARIKATAYLEGDFTLRSGKKSKYYMDKYLFETQPDILAALGTRLAAHRTPATKRIAGAELGGGRPGGCGVFGGGIAVFYRP